MPAEIAIRAEHLSKRYGARSALDDLTFEVRRGEVFGLLGPNGAGKTTAVRLLAGLTEPSGGAGWVLGLPLGDREARRRIGYMPELFRHPPWLTGREVLWAHARLAGIAVRAGRREIARVLAEVGLEARADERVGRYSKGMQQRLALAAALLGEPDVVLLDEPTSALDPVGRREVREHVREIRARGAAVILNSHLLSEVERVCDRVAVVRAGRVVAQGTVDELCGRPGLRIRLERPDDAVRTALEPFGTVRADGEWLDVDAADPARIADAVAAAVAAGGRVVGVETRRGTLEDRLLELLGGQGG
ncbi:MAG: ABC transporter ATP-binding protein [Firmicutes bacterium]|nr:ABC transporter ATP-binding protein [Bacillota bacterium]